MFIGVIILCLGVLLLITTIYPEIQINFSLVWPVALMMISVYQMFKNKVFNVSMVIFFYIGMFFFLENLNIFKNDISALFFPILVILIGAMIIIDRLFNKNKVYKRIDKTGRLQYNGIFSGVEEKVQEKNFKGAVITSVFGGVDLDLRNVTIKEKEIVLDVYAIFGGSNLILPEGYDVILNSFALFGGNENKYDSKEETKGKIIMNCYSVFGGTEIK